MNEKRSQHGCHGLAALGQPVRSLQVWHGLRKTLNPWHPLWGIFSFISLPLVPH